MPTWCKSILRILAGFISVCSASLALFVPIAGVLVFYDEPDLLPPPSVGYWLLGRLAFVLTMVALVACGSLVSLLFLRFARHGRFRSKPKVLRTFTPGIVSAQGLGL